MAVLREFLTPSVVPQAVIASRRSRRMTDRQFYEEQQQAPQVSQQTPQQQQTQSPTGPPELQQRQFQNQPITSDYLGAQFERYKNRSAPPSLDPGARVKSPNAELVQPSTFQKYYEQMGLIDQRGNDMLGAAQAAAAYKRMQALNDVRNTSTGGGQQGGNQVEGVMPAPGDPGQVANQVRQIAAERFGWSGAEWDALYGLVQRESGWNPAAANPTSSARGLFQKMINMHGPIESTVEGQAMWGLNYIKQRYGSPSAALRHWLSRVPINGKDVGHWY